MESLKNTGERKSYIRLGTIDSSVTTISVKESRCTIDTYIERETS